MPDLNELAVSGTRNLLQDCAGVKPGMRVLVVTESPRFGFYAPGLTDCMEQAAEQLGLRLKLVEIGFMPTASTLPERLAEAMEEADLTVFFARLGDQLRFVDMPRGARVIVSYAISPAMLASSFGTIPHRAMVAMMDLANRAIGAAKDVRITCPAGTDVRGQAEMPDRGGDTTVRRFPLSVHTPVPAHTFSGQVALPGFLTGTGSMYYEPYTMEFDGAVLAHLEQGLLTGFSGSASDVDRAERHYDHVSELLGIDRKFVHSWHTGIHPGCAFEGRAGDSYERWSGAAFGNPRLLHFHTCGAYAPGEISWNVIDPTVSLDGLNLWEQGRFCPERLPEGREILAACPASAARFAAPEQAIGLGTN